VVNNVFLNKGKTGIKNYNLFRSIYFSNNEMEILFRQSYDIQRVDKFFVSFYPISLRYIVFYFILLCYVQSKQNLNMEK